ncbi:hypothetical protein CUMW_265270 [Citrus unshiu]|uniref:Uncharacterized protein n=1 Tax=Citrus unshiu TaxID=55188 RepID=A0A2H5QVC8_CITUN|nr:hypothetical protein CUMW_265270 [Citrus unshiu]
MMDLLVRNQSTMRHLSAKDMILKHPWLIMSLILMSSEMGTRMNLRAVSEAEVALLGQKKTKRGKEVEGLWLNTTALVFQLVKKPLSWLRILVFWLIHQFQSSTTIGVEFQMIRRSVYESLLRCTSWFILEVGSKYYKLSELHFGTLSTL